MKTETFKPTDFGTMTTTGNQVAVTAGKVAYGSAAQTFSANDADNRFFGNVREIAAQTDQIANTPERRG